MLKLSIRSPLLDQKSRHDKNEQPDAETNTLRYRARIATDDRASSIAE